MNNYGYKICYREKNSKRYIRYFLTYTYKQAVSALREYIRYPPKERNTDRQLNRPKWKIIPVNKKEVQAGIWREVPF